MVEKSVNSDAPPDYFAVLQVPRRPCLDGSALKEQFHQLSAQLHPDAPGGETAKFAALNAAYRTLSNDAQRIRHFLELEAPSALTRPRNVPTELTDMFMRIAELRRGVAAFRSQRDAATSAISKASLAAGRADLQQKLTTISCNLDRIYEAAVNDVRALGACTNASAEVHDQLPAGGKIVWARRPNRRAGRPPYPRERGIPPTV